MLDEPLEVKAEACPVEGRPGGTGKGDPQPAGLALWVLEAGRLQGERVAAMAIRVCEAALADPFFEVDALTRGERLGGLPAESVEPQAQGPLLVISKAGVWPQLGGLAWHGVVLDCRRGPG